MDHERAGIGKCGKRWAVEARRKERGGEQDQVQWRRDEQQQKERQQNTEQEQGKQGKHVRFDQEEQLEETKADSTDEPEVTGRLAEMRTGCGQAEEVQAEEVQER